MLDHEDQSLSRAELEARRGAQPRLTLSDSEGEPLLNETSKATQDRRLSLAVAGSGSKGNASFVFDRLSGEGILIDAGICKRDVLATSEQAGFDLQHLRGIFISHSHSDHVKNIGVITRGLKAKGVEVPLYVHTLTFSASRDLKEIANTNEVRFFEEGDMISFDDLAVKILPTSHDTDVSFGFRIDAGDDALGYITDTGTLLPDAFDALSGVRILGLESNHDQTMLRNGPYPLDLQERVGSDHGHLNNEQAAQALETLLSSPRGARLEKVVALHISENNNTYRLPVETLRAVVAEKGSDVQVTCAYQKRAVFIS